MIASELGTLVDIQTGKLDANASSNDGQYPFFTCARKPLKIDNWKYDLDAVLVAGNGDLNVKHYKGKFDAYQRTYILSIPDIQKLNSRYLYYFMDTYLERLREQSIGGIIKYIKLGMLKNAQIPLPPLDEQKRIAAILDQADALRRLRQKSLDKLNTLAQSIFHEMFVEGHSESWPTTLIDEVVLNVRTGPFGSQLLHSEFVNKGIAVLGIDNVVSNKFLWAKPRFITSEKYEQLKRYTVQSGDVLITIMGTCGRCAIVPQGIPVAINTKHICCLRPDNEKVLSTFLKAAFLNHPKVLRQLGVEAKGAVMPGLNMGIIKSLNLPLPPLALQQQYADRLVELDLEIEREQRANLKSDELFSSLQQRAFRREL